MKSVFLLMLVTSLLVSCVDLGSGAYRGVPMPPYPDLPPVRFESRGQHPPLCTTERCSQAVSSRQVEVRFVDRQVEVPVFIERPQQRVVVMREQSIPVMPCPAPMWAPPRQMCMPQPTWIPAPQPMPCGWTPQPAYHPVRVMRGCSGNPYHQ